MFKSFAASPTVVPTVLTGGICRPVVCGFLFSLASGSLCFDEFYSTRGDLGTGWAMQLSRQHRGKNPRASRNLECRHLTFDVISQFLCAIESGNLTSYIHVSPLPIRHLILGFDILSLMGDNHAGE